MFQVYLFCLILFGGLAALSVFGDFLETDVGDLDLDAGSDLDLDVGSDLDVDAGVDVDADLEGYTAAEKIFSIRGGLYSLFGFGLTGTLLTLAGAEASSPLTVGLSAGTGLAAGWLVTRLIRWLRSGEAGRHPGDVTFEGRLGRVTLALGPGTPGRVRVRRGERTHELRALPHPSSPEAPAPRDWDAVLVVEMKDGVALVTPVDGDDLQLEP